MTELGRVRQRRRPFLIIALILSAIWAAYCFWLSGTAKPDFMIKVGPTDDVIEFADYRGTARPSLPYYSKGRFFAVGGKPIRPRDVIRDERSPENVDYFRFTASFFLDDGATQADFARATRLIWNVCDVPIFVAIHGQKEMSPILPVSEGRDCRTIFPSKSK